MGPSAIRYAGLDAAHRESSGRAARTGETSRPRSPRRARSATSACASCRRSRRPASASPTSSCAPSARSCIPLVLGGDHSVALGTLGGLARAARAGRRALARCARRPQPAGDLADRERPRDAARGRARSGGPEFDSAALPAARRSIGATRHSSASARWTQAERELLGELDARVYTMSDIDRLGVERGDARGARARRRRRRSSTSASTWTCSTPRSLPASGRPCAAGSPTARRTSRWSSCPSRDSLGSLEVVEVNPILDRENETAKLAVELVASALGARIL